MQRPSAARHDFLPVLRKIDLVPEQLAKIKFTVTLPGAASPAATGQP